MQVFKKKIRAIVERIPTMGRRQGKMTSKVFSIFTFYDSMEF